MARALPAYVTADDLKGALPAQWFEESADDDGDGAADVAAEICDAASDTVDSYLQGRYELPIMDATGLAKLAETARVRALWLCFQRRGRHGENNPWEEEWKRWEKKLAAIERGEVPLIVERAEVAGPVDAPGKVGVSKRPLRSAPRGGGVPI